MLPFSRTSSITRSHFYFFPSVRAHLTPAVLISNSQPKDLTFWLMPVLFFASSSQPSKDMTEQKMVLACMCCRGSPLDQMRVIHIIKDDELEDPSADLSQGHGCTPPCKHASHGPEGHGVEVSPSTSDCPCPRLTTSSASAGSLPVPTSGRR